VKERAQSSIDLQLQFPVRNSLQAYCRILRNLDCFKTTCTKHMRCQHLYAYFTSFCHICTYHEACPPNCKFDMPEDACYPLN
jgi:hypothetical protein